MKKSIYSKRLDRLCELLTLARTDAGLTQRELAERLERPHSYVAKIEIGERRLDVIEFVDFCEKLNIAPQSLLEKL